MCFVNDSSSDRDSDAEDSRTETSLDTPLSPMVYDTLSLNAYYTEFCILKLKRMHLNWAVFVFPLSPYRVNRVHLCLTGIQERKTWTRRILNSGGYSGGCRRRRVWLWLWPVPWPACRWRWRDRFSYTAGPPWQTWSVRRVSKNRAVLYSFPKAYCVLSFQKGFRVTSERLLIRKKTRNTINLTQLCSCALVTTSATHQWEPNEEESEACGPEGHESWSVTGYHQWPALSDTRWRPKIKMEKYAKISHSVIII